MPWKSTQVRIHLLHFSLVLCSFSCCRHTAVYLSHCPTAGYLGCFQSLTITNNAPLVNTLALPPWAHRLVSLWGRFFLGKRNGIAESEGTGLFLVLIDLGKLPAEWLYQFTVPPTAYDSCPHLTNSQCYQHLLFKQIKYVFIDFRETAREGEREK